MLRHLRRSRVIVLSAIFGVFVSFLTFISARAAIADDSIPALQWPAISAGNTNAPLTGASGSITLPCNGWDTNLSTYSATGQLVRNIDHNSTIDGVPNCIAWPTLGKDDDVYGIPGGVVNGRYMSGPNLVAYHGNTLKWKFPINCYNYGSSVAVGAGGNVYALNRVGNEVHLLGLDPDLSGGQTQPTVVLDKVIPGQSDCSVMLFPYKNGIAVYGSGFNGARFYTYNGTLAAETTSASSWGGDPINADGQLFHAVYSPVSGGSSISIQMFDPRTNSVAWTALASTPGAPGNAAEIHPMPNGGVAVVIQEQKMDSSGIPSVPTQWVTTLALISSNGTKTQSLQIPDTYASNGTWQHQVFVDAQGNITILRPLTLNTGISTPSTVPAVDIAMYDPASGTWPYHQVMSGDLTAAGGPYGYDWYGHANNANDTAVGNGTVFLEATCQGNCADASTKLYALQVPGAAVDYPRGEVLSATVPAQPASGSYVAMGDSFSSGEGVGSYEAGTDAPNVNMCHRSSESYPRIIAADMNFGSTAFVACSGATTDIVFNGGNTSGGWDEPAQMMALSAITQRVTLTIGGNDLGFSGVLTSCVNSPDGNGWGCSHDATLTAAVSSRMDALAGTTSNVNEPSGIGVIHSILNVLEEINNRTSGQAKIYIGGYPHLFGSDLSNYETSSTAPGGGFCAPDVGGSYSYADAQWINDRTDQVNTIIQSAVSAAKNEGIAATYVPSGFGGHAWCDSSSPTWFNGIVLDSNVPPAPLPESMHPDYPGVVGGYVPEFETLMN